MELFFIALLPPAEIQEEVNAFKQYAAANFNSKHALRSPPHITLIPPFRWLKDQQRSVLHFLSQFSSQAAPFPVSLRHFDCFAPRVIFVDVEETPKLYQLQNDLALAIQDQLGVSHRGSHGFHPHMTVAFRDLKPEDFPTAWAYFGKQSYESEFEAKNLTLLRHSVAGWQLVQTFPLAG